MPKFILGAEDTSGIMVLGLTERMSRGEQIMA